MLVVNIQHFREPQVIYDIYSIYTSTFVRANELDQMCEAKNKSARQINRTQKCNRQQRVKLDFRIIAQRTQQVQSFSRNLVKLIEIGVLWRAFFFFFEEHFRIQPFIHRIWYHLYNPYLHLLKHIFLFCFVLLVSCIQIFQCH